MKKIYLFLLLCISFFVETNARTLQENDIQQKREIQYDLNTAPTIRTLDADKIQEFSDQKEFDYTEQEESDNWWSRFKDWISQWWRKLMNWLFDIDSVTGFWLYVLQSLPYILILLILLLIAWLFLKVNPKEILLEKTPSPDVLLSEEEDIIHNKDIQQLIDQAISDKNYRLAIRYYYLLVLKKLSAKEIIEWEAQKTNEDYSNEVTDKLIKKQFKTITRIYDFIWYGSFEVNEKLYRRAEKEFKHIATLIQS
ncbi:DUF4129 domain-containing protein [Aquimarina hainanensis]|uniref:DUF4129 domain-containing protein n=1 Tax=Aquimarina hainanensis TaxID=1578017 RepID=A0ABW5N4G9_9FLAO